MPHARTHLRDAAKAALAAGVPAVAGRVSGIRQHARNRAGLPAIEVSTPADAWQRLSDDGSFARDVQLTVAAIHAVSDDSEDALDALAADIEAAIFGLVAEVPFTAAIIGVEAAFDPGDPGEARPAVLTTIFALRVFAEEDDPQTLT